jgi:hypothetical protein
VAPQNTEERLFAEVEFDAGPLGGRMTVRRAVGDSDR